LNLLLHQLYAHILPDLEWVEKKYHDRPVVVIGVHSAAKFNNEQEAENIGEAVGRYEISHPVVVDKGMAIWQSYDVSGWPTLVVIDPKGNVVSSRARASAKTWTMSSACC
jgi:hypothetical protein